MIREPKLKNKEKLIEKLRPFWKNTGKRKKSLGRKLLK